MTDIEGSCLCDAVHYRVTGPFKRLNLCHCSMCQKSHGSAFAPYLRVEKKDFHFSTGADQVVTYESTDGVLRSFCGRCGSNLQWIRIESDGLGVAAGTLDTPVDVLPAAQFWCESSQAWHRLRDDVPAYPTEP